MEVPPPITPEDEGVREYPGLLSDTGRVMNTVIKKSQNMNPGRKT